MEKKLNSRKYYIFGILMFFLSFLGIFFLMIVNAPLFIFVMLLICFSLWLHFYNFGRGMKKLESMISKKDIELNSINFLKFCLKIIKNTKIYELSFFPAYDFFVPESLGYPGSHIPDHYQIKREVPLERFSISENLRSTIENIRIRLLFFRKRPKMKLAEYIHEKAPHLLEEANRVTNLHYISLMGASGKIWAVVLLDYNALPHEFLETIDLIDKIAEVYENK